MSLGAQGGLPNVPTTVPANSSTPPTASFVPAYRSRSAWLTLLFVLTLGVVTDLVSKYLAFERVAGQPVVTVREDVVAAGPTHLHLLIPAHKSVVVVPKLLEFTLVYNPGAVFGIGAGKRWFFVLFTAAAVFAGLLFFARATSAKDRWTHCGIALILSGGVGNLYDRLNYACVRDFIHPLPGVKLPFGIKWPNGGSDEVWPWVSNLADLYLIIGVAIILRVTLRGSKKLVNTTTPTATPPAP
jgi:signal peptidase II